MKECNVPISGYHLLTNSMLNFPEKAFAPNPFLLISEGRLFSTICNSFNLAKSCCSPIELSASPGKNHFIYKYCQAQFQQAIAITIELSQPYSQLQATRPTTRPPTHPPVKVSKQLQIKILQGLRVAQAAVTECWP